MPFRSRDMIDLPSSQICRQAKFLFSPEKEQWGFLRVRFEHASSQLQAINLTTGHFNNFLEYFKDRMANLGQMQLWRINIKLV